MASNCIAQNKPKRFKEPYFSAMATGARAGTFILTSEGKRRVDGCSGKAPQCVHA